MNLDLSDDNIGKTKYRFKDIKSLTDYSTYYDKAEINSDYDEWRLDAFEGDESNYWNIE